jgi:hypothetical protein
LAAGLTDKSLERLGENAGTRLRVDIGQPSVHLGTESDELPDERLLDLALVGCGLVVAAPRAEAGKKDERRAHEPYPSHRSSSGPSKK